MRNLFDWVDLDFCGIWSLTLYRHSWFILDLPLFFLFVEKASSAYWLIHLFSTNQLNLFTFHYSLGKGGLCRTVHTDCAKLGHLFGQGDQIDYVAEWLPLEGSIKGWDHNNFILIGQLLTEFHNLREELPLVNTNHIIGLAEGKNVHEFVGLEGFLGYSEY